MHRRLNDLLEKTRVLIRDTNGSLKQLGQLDGGTGNEQRKRKMEQEKLAGDFQSVLRSFQQLQKQAITREKETVRAQRAASFGRGGGHGGGGGYEPAYDEDASLIDDARRADQAQLDMQIDTQAAFIEEREEGIKELESQMLEVNDIFKDLGNIIVEQGEMLDNIEYNMTATSTHVDNGREQLGKASRYQKKARNKMMCLLVIVVIAAAILTVILVTSLKPGSGPSPPPPPPPPTPAPSASVQYPHGG
eukprot:UC1_evm2s1699